MALARSHRSVGSRAARVRSGVVSGLALLALCAGPSFADSPMYRGGSNLSGSFADRLSLPLALSWRYTASYTPAAAYNPASPAVVKGVVYYSGGDRILALDAVTGAMKWRFPEDEELTSVVRTSPAVADGRVFFGTTDGKLHAISADKGKVIWTFDTRSSITASPTVSEGVVYFGSADGRLWALDCASGNELPAWKGGCQLQDEVGGAPTVANGFVYAVTLNQALQAVGVATGKVRYSVRLPGPVMNQSVAVCGDYIYMASGDNVICFLGRNPTVRRWAQKMPDDVASSPAVCDAGVFVVSTDGLIVGLDPLSGRPIWKTFPKIKLATMAPPTVSGNLLFVTTLRGSIYAYDTATGTLKWTYLMSPTSTRTDSIVSYVNIAAPAVASDGSLFIVGDDASIASFAMGAVDTSAPEIDDMLPTPGIVINGQPPIRFEATVIDDGSGVNTDTIKLLIDGDSVPRKPETDDTTGKASAEKIGFTFDPMTGTLSYDTPEPTVASAVKPLADGRHIVAVIATDWAGNTVTKKWSFTVDNSIKRSGRKQTKSSSDRSRGMMGPGGSGMPGMSGGGSSGSGSSGRRRGGAGGAGMSGS